MSDREPHQITDEKNKHDTQHIAEWVGQPKDQTVDLPLEWSKPKKLKSPGTQAVRPPPLIVPNDDTRRPFRTAQIVPPPGQLRRVVQVLPLTAGTGLVRHHAA